MMQLTDSEIRILKLKERVAMIDYIMETLCTADLRESGRIPLRNMRYSYQTEIDDFEQHNIGS